MRYLFIFTLVLLVFYTSLCVSRLLPGHGLLCVMSSAALIGFIIQNQIRHRAGHKEGQLERIIAWASSVALSIWSSFILFCLYIDCINLVLIGVQLLGLERLQDFNKSNWQFDAIEAAFIASLLTSVLGLIEAIRGPVVKHVRVPLPAGLEALAGFKIAQISDLHIGAVIQRDYIAKVVRKVSGLPADIIAITGDIADGQPDALQEYSQPLAELKAPLGKYFITGNHEYYSGAPAWIAEAQRLGYIPLINENRIVDYKQKKVMVAGVTDLTAHQFIAEHRSDPAKAVASGEHTDFRLLLAHQPESCFDAERAGFHLQLSGHTHGGQYFPFTVLVRLAKKYAKGLHRYKNLWLYVNPGTGFWGAANRFGVRAEITLLELVA